MSVIGLLPTDEQQAVMAARDAAPDGCMQIAAVAGSGKTSTLQMLAATTSRYGLYLAFNRSAAEEARRRFPHNVEAKTTHSLAYRAMQMWQPAWKTKLNRPDNHDWRRGHYRTDLIRIFDLKKIKVADGHWIDEKTIASGVMDAVRRFEISWDFELTEKHAYDALRSVDWFCQRKYEERMRDWPVDFLHPDSPAHAEVLKVQAEAEEQWLEYQTVLLSYARAVWDMRIDPKSPMHIGHDGYLKRYQLSCPKIEGYEYILLDEAQDTNPCLLNIITNQRRTPIIAVGDPHQAIYQFRGAVDGMSLLDWPVLPLHRSFRYGKPIANLARLVLEAKTGHEVPIQGAPDVSSVICEIGPRSDMPTAYLSRTNAGFLEPVIRDIADSRPISVYADMRDLSKTLRDLHRIDIGDHERVQSSELKAFTSLADVIDEQNIRPEVSRAALQVKDWGDETPDFADILEKHRDSSDPMAVYSTAHKAKGLQWSQVVLMDDFPNMRKPAEYKRAIRDEERNLLYVALTRAQNLLQPNGALKAYLGPSDDALSNDDQRERVAS